MTSTFVCDACGGEFTKAWTDAEAEAEAERVFGERMPDPEDRSEVCDECYVKLMRGAEEGGYAIHTSVVAADAIEAAERGTSHR